MRHTFMIEVEQLPNPGSTASRETSAGLINMAIRKALDNRPLTDHLEPRFEGDLGTVLVKSVITEHPDVPPPVIVVVVQGGVIQYIGADQHVRVIVLDYDIMDEENPRTVRNEDGGLVNVYDSEHGQEDIGFALRLVARLKERETP